MMLKVTQWTYTLSTYWIAAKSLDYATTKSSIEEIHKISLTLMDALFNATREIETIKLRLCAIAFEVRTAIRPHNGIFCVLNTSFQHFNYQLGMGFVELCDDRLINSPVMTLKFRNQFVAYKSHHKKVLST